jgi:hypothetical protein
MKNFPPWVLMMGIFSLLFGCGSESNYHKKGGKWHYEGTPINREAEPVNFQPLGNYFAKDDQVGYYRGAPIHDGEKPSDGPSFEALNRFYAKDRGMVYYCDTERDSKEYWTIKRSKVRMIRNAEPASFRLLGDGYTARDRLHLFREDQVVPVRDIDSYELLEHGFARDKVIGYYLWAEVAGSDGASFVSLDSHYAGDKARIYYVSGFKIGGAIKGVRHESFKALEGGYATDGARAYYRGAVITTKDADTLEAMRVMGYARTAQQVFHDGKLMPDADAASFALAEKFNGEFDATDKSGRFSAGERVKAGP